jgi:hypothetical protein
VATKLRLALAVTLIGAAAALGSCAAQVIRWSTTTTQGVILDWPVAALIYAGIKVCIQWSHRRVGSRAERRQAKCSLAVSIVLVGTNTVLLVVLLHFGGDLFNAIVYATVALWLVGARRAYLNWKEETFGQRLLRVAVYVNIVPMYLQGVSYLLNGVGGMPLWNLGVLETLCLAAFLVSAWPFDQGMKRSERRAAFAAGGFVFYRITRHELFAQTFLGICGLVSFYLLPAGELPALLNELEAWLLTLVHNLTDLLPVPSSSVHVPNDSTAWVSSLAG